MTESDPATGVISDIRLEEESYWRFIPDVYALFQMQAQYNFTGHFYATLGFETSVNRRSIYDPYTLRITGFTENMSHVDHLLNDFRKTNVYSAVTVGVGYVFGFGHSREDQYDRGMAFPGHAR